MAIFRRRRPDGPLEPESAPYPHARTITAAAMPVQGPGVTRLQKARTGGKQSTGAQDWQRMGWYYFDVIGELRAPLVWIANAISQADIRAVELDPQTGKATGPTDNEQAQAIAAQAFGGAAKRATLLRVLALCWQTVGEAWTIVKPVANAGGVPQPDEWIVLAPDKLKPSGQGANTRWTYRDPVLATDVVLETQARLFRTWQPHPHEYAEADSAVRAALPVCREVEKASQNIVARLDSRLAVAGLLALANEMDFPRGEHDTTAAAFMDLLLEVAETGIQQPGTPAAVVPIAFNAPGELIANGGAAAFIDIATEFVSSVVDLRDNALGRLARALDMPDDVAAGTQGESNHWTAWQVEESTYKIFIEPLLNAIGDSVTVSWFRDALKAAGIANPERYEIGWDTTAIVARPDDTENLRDLHDRLLISDDYMRSENGVPEDAKPTAEERTRRLLEKWVGGAPTLIADPNVADALGVTVTVDPAAAGVSGATEVQGNASADAAEPAARELPAAPSTPPAADGDDLPAGLAATAGLLVRQGLDRAGGRLLTASNRGQFKNVPRHELYRHIRPTSLDGLVDVRHVDGVAEAFGMDEGALKAAVEFCVTRCLMTGAESSRELVTAALKAVR